MLTLLASGGLFFFQNCSQPAELGISSIQELSYSSILVYDDSEEDQKFLQEKIRGYKSPGMAEIFGRWATFSGDVFYPNAAAIQIEEELAYCLDAQRKPNGDFDVIRDPLDGKNRAPTSIVECQKSKAFNAKTWTVVEDPKRLYTPMNSTSLIGFISPVDFDNFTHDTVLSSKAKDDDSILSVIAFNQDETGTIDILAAARTQGGWTPSEGWSIIHFRNGQILRVFAGPILEVPNRNNVAKLDKDGKPMKDSAGNPIYSSPGDGDTLGWSDRKTFVRVVRRKNIVQAYASPVGLPGVLPTEADISPDSLIQIDLENSANGLEVFQGSKPYGYASFSQAGSEFLSDHFETNIEVHTVYDLKSGAVYTRQDDGTYAILPGVDAITKIGYPRKANNPETGKIISLKWDRTYKVQ